MIIYMTTNQINGKKYIGLDTNNNPNYLGSGTAFKLAVKKYGKENFKKEILCYCGSMEELLEKEKFYISFYNAVSSVNFYNIAEGGGTVKTCPVIQYTKEGVLIKQWSSIRECEQETGFNNSKISSACKGSYGRRTAYGFVWRYYGDAFDKYPVKPQINITEAHRKSLSKRQKGKNNIMANRKGLNNPKSVKICQYDLNGKYIQTWDSITEAEESLNIYGISSCCNLRYISAGNFLWVFDKEPNKEKIIKEKCSFYGKIRVKKESINNLLHNSFNMRKSVSQYSLDKKFIKTFNSITEAMKETGATAIRLACQGKLKSSGGFIWTYNKDIVRTLEKSK